MYRKNKRSWIKHIDFMIMDIICLQIAFVLAYMIRFDGGNAYEDVDYRNLAIVFMLIDFFVEIFFDSFKNVLKRKYVEEFRATCKHVFLVELVTVFYLFSTQLGDVYSRISYYVMVPLYVLISYIGRYLLKVVLKRRGFHTRKRTLLVLAPKDILKECLEAVGKTCIGYSAIGAVVLDADLKGTKICGIPIVADSADILNYACSGGVDEVLIPPCSESDYPGELVQILMEMGIVVHIGIMKVSEISGSRRFVEKIGTYTVITTSMNYAGSIDLFMKRLMDIVGGIVGCLISIILMIVVGPMIFISSPGPIFFVQERVGRNGRKFKMYKFRTMYLDAEERKKELMEQNRIKDGRMFKMDFDPRIIGNKILEDGTRQEGLGSFLRRTSLDEFPQFFNILKGDMSLVGTRPPTVDEWKRYEPHHRARLAFRPGLTGLWQVSGRSTITDFEEVVKLDTKYIDEWSLEKDIKILVKTLKVWFKDEGAM